MNEAFGRPFYAYVKVSVSSDGTGRRWSTSAAGSLVEEVTEHVEKVEDWDHEKVGKKALK